MPELTVFKWIIEEKIESLVVNKRGGETDCRVIDFCPLNGYLRLTLTYVENERDLGPGGLGID